MASVNRLLSVPLEVRLRIYDHLLLALKPVKIVPRPPWEQNPEDNTNPDHPSTRGYLALTTISVPFDGSSTTWAADTESWAIMPHSLSSQLLRTCRDIYTETLPILYCHNSFDLTSRESLKLLLRNIGVANCSLIKHIVLDWDPLQDFAWCLAKDEYCEALRGLTCIQLAYWRVRNIRGTSIQWRSVKSYERQLCQAAKDILVKHPSLNILAEETFHRRIDDPTTTFMCPNRTPNNRIKWRFVCSASEVKSTERIIDLDADLQELNADRSG